MAFQSVEYLAFLLILAFIYYLIPDRLRVWILLAGSAYFYYRFHPAYLGILSFSILMNFFLGRLISASKGHRRTLAFVIGLGFNILFLFFFRIDLLAVLSNAKYSLRSMNIIMPLGISFFTFTAMSSLIDAFRDKAPVEKNAAVYAVHMSFFPKLLQGPIERPNFMRQIASKHPFRYEEVAGGLQLILWGLFKKIVVADRAGQFVSLVYGSFRSYSGMPLVLATIYFSVQIYADFSGYTDIARGSAKIFGYQLSLNFNLPYLSRSISEFWSRWHMSLSSWFRDYVYLPMSYAVSKRIKKDRILFVNSDQAIYFLSINTTFFLCGLWHGTGWHFVVWGLVFGFGLSLSVLSRKFRKTLLRKTKIFRYRKTLRFLKVMFVFAIVSWAWIFFRANTLSEALAINRKILQAAGQILCFKSFLPGAPGWGIGAGDFVILTAFTLIMFAVESKHANDDLCRLLNRLPPFFRFAVYYVILLSIMLFGVFSRSPFLYFKF